MDNEIRIDKGDGLWCSFRPSKWTFGARMGILGAASDLEALDLILPFVVSWNLTDVDGVAVPFDKGSKALLNLDDGTARWLVRSWFEARELAVAVPKVS